MIGNDTQLKLAVFVGAAMAVIASSDPVPAIYRVAAGAIAAGCGAFVALLRPAGMANPSQVSQQPQQQPTRLPPPEAKG